MFEALDAVIEELSLPVDTRAAGLLDRINRLRAKAAVLIGEIDRAALWELDGATSLRSWLRDTGLGPSDVARLASTAPRLKHMPVLAAAWEKGELSSGQVEAIVRNVPSHLADQFAEHESELIPTHAEALTDQPEPPERVSEFHLSQTMDGVWVADGTFDAESGALITKAIELAISNDYSVPLAQRRAEALAGIFRFWLDNQNLTLGGRHRPHLNVIVDVETLRGELVDEQQPLSRETVDRLLCDCVLHRMLVDRKQGRGDRPAGQAGLGSHHLGSNRATVLGARRTLHRPWARSRSTHERARSAVASSRSSLTNTRPITAPLGADE